MTYYLTPEQARKNKTVDLKALVLPFLIVVGTLAMFSIPALLQGGPMIPKVLLLWCLVMGLSGVGFFVGIKNYRRKKTNEVEIGAHALVLISPNGPQEIPYGSIRKVGIYGELDGRVRMIFIKADQAPSSILEGFEDMDGLAGNLEKMIPDPKLVERVQMDPSKKKKLGGMPLVIGLTVLILGAMGGITFLLIKMGMGPLLGPFFFILSGILRFTSNRQDSKSRQMAILFIFIGITWAAFKLFGH